MLYRKRFYYNYRTKTLITSERDKQHHALEKDHCRQEM